MVNWEGRKQGDMLEARLNYDKYAAEITAWMLLAICVALDLSIILLIMRLLAKQKKMLATGVSNSFAGETKNLLVIMFFYSLSFLMRFMVDLWLKPQVIPAKSEHTCVENETKQHIICHPYYDAVYSMIFTFVWDFFPIASILVFHRRNFATAREVKGGPMPRSVSVDTQQTLEDRIK